MPDDGDRDYRIIRGDPPVPGERSGSTHYHLEAGPDDADRDVFRTCRRPGCDIDPRYVRPGVIVDGLPTPEFLRQKRRMERPRLQSQEERRRIELRVADAAWVPAEAWLPTSASLSERMAASIGDRVGTRNARRRVPEGIREYRFPDDERLGSVILRTAIINGRRYGRVLGTASEGCRFSEDDEGHPTARHEIDITSDYVDLVHPAPGRFMADEVRWIDSSDENAAVFQRIFAGALVDRAEAGWTDHDCPRRASYMQRAAAQRRRARSQQLREDAARLVEVEAELGEQRTAARVERARSQQWVLIAAVLALVLIGILLSRPDFFGS